MLDIISNFSFVNHVFVLSLINILCILAAPVQLASPLIFASPLRMAPHFTGSKIDTGRMALWREYSGPPYAPGWYLNCKLV